MSNQPNHPTHTFSIENTKIPGTDSVFGPKFSGSFTIHRPSLRDKCDVALRRAAAMSIHGAASPDMFNEATSLTFYIFAFFATVADKELPAWFDAKQIFTEEEEVAVYAVWAEVNRWLETFMVK